MNYADATVLDDTTELALTFGISEPDARRLLVEFGTDAWRRAHNAKALNVSPFSDEAGTGEAK